MVLLLVDNPKSPNQNEVKVPRYLKFAFGGMANCGATTISHPLDVMKNIMQTSGVGKKGGDVGSFGLIKEMIHKNGIKSLYKGLTASYLRQLTYGSTRIGVFDSLNEHYSSDGKKPGIAMRACFGMVAGVAGSIVGLPADVALTRMATDSRRPPDQRRNYTNVFNALSRMVKEEGPHVLLSGASATIFRCLVVNFAQLTAYATAKETALASGYFGDNLWCHIVCSISATLCSTLSGLPVDISKTRIQNQPQSGPGKLYNGMVDCWIKIVKNEGIGALWKGFTPSILRNGPQTVFMFIFLEQLTSFYKRTYSSP